MSDRVRQQGASLRGKEVNRSDLVPRILVAIPLAVLACVLIAAGGWYFTVGLIAVGIICLHEFYELVEARRPLRIVGFTAMVAVGLGAHLAGAPGVLAAAWLSVPLMFATVVLRPSLEGATDSILATGLGVWWLVVALGHAILLRDLGHGGGMVLDALVGTFAMDTGAYFAGRAFGTKPLAPRISPKKTVEGLLGGAVATVAVLLIASLYQPWLDLGTALAVALVIAILAPAGDLFESILKRDAGAKDASRVLGPHGGLLDRLDGVFFSIVGVYWLWLVLG